eukprot:365051-Chlamydomonas_euryale.AAC.1
MARPQRCPSRQCDGPSAALPFKPMRWPVRSAALQANAMARPQRCPSSQCDGPSAALPSSQCDGPSAALPFKPDPNNRAVLLTHNRNSRNNRNDRAVLLTHERNNHNYQAVVLTHTPARQ